MASDDDDNAAALGAGLFLGFLGGALVGAALASKPAPQTLFEQRLQNGLAASGFGLASAKLGAGPAGPIWLVTVRFPDGSLLTVHAPSAGAAPFDPVLADDIARRISNALRARVA